MPDQRAAHDKADDDENDADFDEREALLSWISSAPQRSLQHAAFYAARA